MQDYTHRYIARTIIEAGYTLEEARMIDKVEVFPVLYDNRLQVIGDWMGWNEDWLVEAITQSLARENRVRRWGRALAYRLFGGMTAGDWQQIARAYARLKED